MNKRPSRPETEFVDNRDCEVSLLSEYKFYLAFENSFCEDYVSEKFWNALRRSVVPIVMGGCVKKSQ